MFCPNCGEALGEGKAFCKNCGAPAPDIAEKSAAEVTGLADTQVKPQAGLAAQQAAPLPAPEALSLVPPPPPPPGLTEVPPPVPPAVGYDSSRQPPNGPPGWWSRHSLIVGIAAAAVIVLAGAGTGAYLLLRGDDAPGTSTTLAGSSTTDSQTTTTGASTTQTVPGLTTTTGGSTTTNGSTATNGSTTTSGSTTTFAPDTSLEDYLTAREALVALLAADDIRIPALATQINNAAPDVPQAVYDELQAMMGKLDATYTSLGEVWIPAEFEESHPWLDEAAMHMGNRIYATIQGIEAMWDTDSVAAATEFFDLGRQSRDDFREAFEKYQDLATDSG